jgi:hypothetical protein
MKFARRGGEIGVPGGIPLPPQITGNPGCNVTLGCRIPKNIHSGSTLQDCPFRLSSPLVAGLIEPTSKERKSFVRHIFSAAGMIFLSAGLISGQAESPFASEKTAEAPGIIALEVRAGTPLPVVLDKEIRIQKTGQPIHGKIAEPVYAFDKLVVPAGSEVTGSVTRIAGVSALKRTAATHKSPPRLREFCSSPLLRNRKTKTKTENKTQP